MSLQVPDPRNKEGVLASQAALAAFEEAILAASRAGANFILTAAKYQPELIVPAGAHGYPGYNAQGVYDPTAYDPNARDQFGVPVQWKTDKESKGLHPFHRNEIMEFIGQAMGALGQASGWACKAHYEANRNMYENRIITGGGGK